MTSWKKKKTYGNDQEPIKKNLENNVENLLLSRHYIRNNCVKKDYKKFTKIDDNIFKKKNIENFEDVLNEYLNFIDNTNIDYEIKGKFKSKFRSLRNSTKLYNCTTDIHFIDLFSRLLKFIKLYNKHTLEAFLLTFVETPYSNNFLNLFTNYYLANFNNLYYDKI